MPCFDKKLEASRDDFYNEEFSTREVDCVITSGKADTRKLLHIKASCFYHCNKKFCNNILQSYLYAVKQISDWKKAGNF